MVSKEFLGYSGNDESVQENSCSGDNSELGMHLLCWLMFMLSGKKTLFNFPEEKEVRCAVSGRIPEDTHARRQAFCIMPNSIVRVV